MSNINPFFFSNSQSSVPKKTTTILPTKSIQLSNSDDIISILSKKSPIIPASLNPFTNSTDAWKTENRKNISLTQEPSSERKTNFFESFVQNLQTQSEKKIKNTLDFDTPKKNEEFKKITNEIKNLNEEFFKDDNMKNDSKDNELSKSILNKIKIPLIKNEEEINPKLSIIPDNFTSKPHFDKKNIQFKISESKTDKPKKTFTNLFNTKVDQNNLISVANFAREEAKISFLDENNTKIKESNSKGQKKDIIDKYAELISKNQEKVPKNFDSSHPIKKRRKKKITLFGEELSANSSEDSMISEVSEVSKSPSKSNISDLDFENIFEEDPFIKKRKSKKTKIQKKLEQKKAFRMREKKEKAVKDYLADTRFHYTSKPMPYQRIPDRTDKKQPPEIKIKQIPDFQGVEGIKIPSLLKTLKPIEFFEEFMPEHIYIEIARLTNISASLEFHKPDAHKNRSWRDVTSEEIKRFVSLLFLFGIIRKYSVNEYWTSDPLLGLSSVRKILNKNRFNEIRRYLCFYDRRRKKEFEKVYPPLDPFYKCRFFIDHINQCCAKVYSPERDLSVDESMIAYMGNHRLKVYMPRKPTKWGFKAFVLAEASSGYVLNMILNEGHKRGENEDLLSKRVVLQILQGFENKGYRVYMDRWYTSADLLSELKKRGIGGCGTIFLSRVGLVNELKKEVRLFKEPGEASFYTNNYLTFVCWYQYRRQVYVLSNFHNADWVNVEKVRKVSYFCKKEYKIYQYDAPLMIKDYTMNMKGVDLFNQRVSYYSVDYNILKWYVRIVFWILEIAMVNSYILYSKMMRKNKLKPLAASDYRIDIIKNLAKWEIDPTQPILIPKNRQNLENDEFENEFNNITYKRKSEKGLNETLINDINIKIECVLEYIGKGVCEYCKKNYKKLKSTSFWCQLCKIGICPECFDKHKLEMVFEKLMGEDDMLPLLEQLVKKKKLKALETHDYYKRHILEPQLQRKKRKKNNKEKNSNEQEVVMIGVDSNRNIKIKNDNEKKLKEVDDFYNMKLTLDLMEPDKIINEEILNMNIPKEKEIIEQNCNQNEPNLNIQNKSIEVKSQSQSVEMFPKPKTTSIVRKTPDKAKKIELFKKLLEELDSEIHTEAELKKLQSITKNIIKKSNSDQISTISKASSIKEIRLTGRHFPTTNPFGRQVNCEFCKKTDNRRTIGYCQTCKVCLCPIYCFEKYHTLLTLKEK